jgi:phosphoribosylformimino-5-aminoimidazole carboxamide ribotide isomerase
LGLPTTSYSSYPERITVRCVFVLDLFNGAVVHAVRGERSRYETIDRFSKVTSSSDPIALIKEIRPREAYIADLNRLLGSGDNLAAIGEIAGLTKTMADIGASQICDLDYLSCDISPVLGTETATLRLIEEASLKRDVVASIDIKNKKVMTGDSELALEPMEVLRRLNKIPLKEIIILDLDRVGTSSGLDGDFLERAVLVSDHALIMGGGVRDVDDLKMLEDLGLQGALVATAVHNGKIPTDMLR